VTLDALGDLNWLAVFVAALAYFAIGALWYAPPVFGKVWMAAGGMAMPEAGTRPSPAIYLTPLVGSVLSAIARGGHLLRHGAVRIREAETDGLGRSERRVPRGGQPGGRDHRRELAVELR
jgi:Protein of unknown function (DUF1761)